LQNWFKNLTLHNSGAIHGSFGAMKRSIKILRWVLVVFVALPITIGTTLGLAHGWPSNWRSASWASSGVLPKADTIQSARIYILASRTGKWKGIFAEHMSLVYKHQNDISWTRFDVVGWGKPVRRNDYVADAYWYGNTPRVIYSNEGAKAEALIPRIEISIAAYPFSKEGDYHIWPGPNSNTFISWVVRHTDGLDAELSSVAVGKDWVEGGFGPAPSKTGYTASLWGYVGLTLAWKEGLEFHLLGSTIGIDPDDMAIKLPALGKLSLWDLKS
jgi:Protein of unknown function (DUF3750)